MKAAGNFTVLTCVGIAWQYGNASLAEMERESGVTYQVRLSNGCRIRVHVFVVYDEAKEVTQPPSQPGGKAQKCYKWPSVSRAQCKKGCQVQSASQHAC